MFCVVSMSFIRGFWTGHFASVTARRFFIIVTLCTCVACTIVCDCFLFPSLCIGIGISISSSDGEIGSPYRFQVSVFCCLGSWAQDAPPPLLCRTVFYSYLFSHCIGRWAPSLREWDSQFEAIFFSLLSSACMYFAIALRCPNPDNTQVCH